MRTAFLSLICTTAFLSSCSYNYYSSIEEPDVNMRPDEGIVVIGAPFGTRVWITSGKVENGKFRGEMFAPGASAGTPESGYLVIKLRALPPGKTYALVAMYFDFNYLPNCGHLIPVFSVNPGHIQYLTSFSFDPAGRAHRLGNHNDIEAASTFMRSSFPALSASIVKATVDIARATNCMEPRPLDVYGPLYAPTAN